MAHCCTMVIVLHNLLSPVFGLKGQTMPNMFLCLASVKHMNIQLPISCYLYYHPTILKYIFTQLNYNFCVKHPSPRLSSWELENFERLIWNIRINTRPPDIPSQPHPKINCSAYLTSENAALQKLCQIHLRCSDNIY